MTIVCATLAGFVVGAILGFMLAAIMAAGAEADRCQECQLRTILE